MTYDSCPKCRSTDDVEAYTRNWPIPYYCTNCEHPFIPDVWPCPHCGSDDQVFKNPFDDDRIEYLCADCHRGFPYPGPSFDPAAVSEGRLSDEDSSWHLEFAVGGDSHTLPLERRITLRNTGTEPLRVAGRDAIAIQTRCPTWDWWMVYGNPDAYAPEDRIELHPGDELVWTFRGSRLGISVADLFLRSGPVYLGEYRFVYWGLESTESAVATRFMIEGGGEKHRPSAQ